MLACIGGSKIRRGPEGGKGKENATRGGKNRRVSDPVVGKKGTSSIRRKIQGLLGGGGGGIDRHITERRGKKGDAEGERALSMSLIERGKIASTCNEKQGSGADHSRKKAGGSGESGEVVWEKASYLAKG